MLFLSLHVLANTSIIFSLHHHSSWHNIHTDCNCYSKVTKFIIFNVIWVILSITIILFLSDTDRLSQISCITLQGTCFDEHTDVAFYSIPGYTLISDAYRISSHCGVAIYLNDFSYERKFTKQYINSIRECDY